MKLTKILQAEITALMNDYWDSYFRGDLEHWRHYLVDDYRNIGGTEEEIWNSKKEILDYTFRIIDQMAGKADIRNKTTEIISYDPYIMVHEFMDLFVKVEEEWTFYGKFRLSSLIQKIDGEWKVLHQHGSYPDAHTEQGEAFAVDKLKKENTQLRDAVKSRTLELENKNRELAIEAALERIRIRTLLMKDSNELAETSTILFKEFKKLDFLPQKARPYFTIVDKEKKTAIVWITKEDGTVRSGSHSVPFNTHKPLIELYEAVEQQKSIHIRDLSGEVLNNYLLFLSTLPHVQHDEALSRLITSPPGRMVFTDAIHAYGTVGILAFEPITQEAQETLIRFAKVFEFTYTRFLDLQKAEAQAREAQIEAALERVRSKSLAMYKTDDLHDVVQVLFEQMKGLSVEMGFGSVSIFIFNEGTRNMAQWLALPGGVKLLNIPYFEHPILSELFEAKEGGDEFFEKVFTVELKNSWIEKGFEVTDYKYLPEEFKEALLAAPGYSLSLTLSKNSGIAIPNFEGKLLNENDKAIMKRVGKVFEQAFIRFLDLQKAEAQAREAKIEASLEKARSRSMGMQSSEELPEVANVLFLEVQALGIPAWSCGYNILAEDKTSATCWMSSEGILQQPFKLRLWGEASFDEMGAFLRSEKTMLVQELGGKPLEEHYAHMKSFPDLKPTFDHIDEQGLSLPTYQINHLCKFNQGFLLFITYEKVPDSHEIFKRFTKVFEQTYTRFLDLQKAEAQAREAQIEASLERTRTQSMIMQHSRELDDTLKVFHEQVLLLGIHSAFSFLWLPDEDKERHIFWAAWTENQNGASVFKTKSINYPLHREEPATAQCLVDWKSGEPVFSYAVPPGGVDDYFAAWKELLEGVDHLKPEYFRGGLHYVEAFMNYGCFGVMVAKDLSEEQKKLLGRFAIEFERTYTRFLDLQKAEAQAREGQIEASLERVRSRSLAMHNTSELQEVIHTVHKELLKLNIAIHGGSFITINSDIDTTLRCWGSGGTADTSEEVHLPLFEKPFCTNLINRIKKGPGFFTEEYSQQEKKEFFAFLFKHEPWSKLDAKKKKETLLSTGGYTRSCCVSKHTSIFIINHFGENFSTADNEILQRFGKVFEQTYTRFLDLQKAEAQAKEAQVELSLERIRAKVTAMQESSELLDIVVAMRSEFVALSHDAHYFWYMRWLPEKYEKAMTSGDGSRIGMVMELPRHIHGDIKLLADWEKSDEPAVVYAMDVDSAVDYIEKMISFGDFKQVDPNAPTLDDIRHIGGLTFIMARTTHGEIGYSLPGVVPNPPAEDVATLVRFAGVFDLAYRRFEDLKETEKSNKETQIELALERVRSRTMGMQKSVELKEVILVVYEQFVKLNVPVEHAGFIMDYKSNDDMHIWLADQHAVPFRVTIPYFDCAHWNSFIDAKQNGKNFFANLLSFEEKNRFYQDLFKIIPGVPQETLDYYFSCPGLAISTVLLDNVGLYIENFSGIPFTEDENSMLMRFGKVFQQTYTRFLDLQKAEAQAREARIEASLERVRSRTMAMQHSNELGDVASVLFREMNQLVTNLWTCGFVLCEKNRNEDEWWLSMDTGFTRGFFLPNIGDYAHATLYEGWLQGDSFRAVQLESDTLHEHYEWLMGMEISRKIFEEMDAAGLERPDWQKLHAAYFSRGYLVLITREPCGEEELFKRFAQVFDLTYTRFLDLQKAEAHAIQAEKDLIEIKAARKKAEDALVELRATQQQLIQAEKMASLGELTAGIAHEIQNPLNFVNNFSEVNEELITELLEEARAGNTIDVLSLATAVDENLKKIIHHGKRADTIVKGMLQHSRNDAGKKELIDINALADEYLRLAYHGLRAKDNTFNAVLETHFDPASRLIEVVPQEISRVLLNLFNNAFYAVNEKKKTADYKYEPTVSVSTKYNDKQLMIKVKDNGNGIPGSVVNKIFQPFFTTKPTGVGTGLGLSLSYDIIKTHGGEITLQSEEGEGAEFSIQLPAK